MSWWSRGAAGAGWFVVGLLIASAPFGAVAILWWSRLGYLPSTSFLFGDGELLLVVLAVSAGGLVEAFRLILEKSLPSNVRATGTLCFVALLVGLMLSAMWYGTLLTPPASPPGKLSYDPQRVALGSEVILIFAGSLAMLVAALREGVKRN
jgi:hypothetical protein